MSQLIFQPVEYSGDLAEIFNEVVRAFHPLIDDFTVLGEIKKESLPESVFGHSRTHVYGSKFLDYFPQQQGPLLVVTSLPLLNKYRLGVLGQGHQDSRKAIVSAYRDSSEELYITAIHELGHVYGLTHEDHDRTYNGRRCPMRTFTSLREANPDSVFCGFCYSKLGIPEPVGRV